MTDVLTQTGLKFFGAMSASISHELKNRFAIINEQAGLLSDLVHMAEGGREIPPERLARMADALKKQVSLADDLLRNMNRFSHSVDQFMGETDVGPVVACSAALARRAADMRNAKLDLQLPEAPATTQTSPFWLMNLIWVLLDAAMGPAGVERVLTLSCETTPEGVLIRIVGAADDAAMVQAVSAASDLAAALDARLERQAALQSVSVLLPS